MKSKFVFIYLVLIGGLSHANIKHETCKISSRATLVTVPATKESALDWGNTSFISTLFSNSGYIADGRKNIEDMNDGDLFTDLTISLGGEKAGFFGNKIKYASYVILKINQKDSNSANGYRTLKKATSSTNPDFYSGAEISIEQSVKHALGYLPTCEKIN